MKESNFVAAEGIHLEQYIHGSFTPTGADLMSILIAPPGPGYHRAVSLARAANEVGTYPIALVERGDEEISGVAAAIHLPPVPEPLSPLGPMGDRIDNFSVVGWAFLPSMRREAVNSGPDERLQEVLEWAEAYMKDVPVDVEGPGSKLAVCAHFPIGD